MARFLECEKCGLLVGVLHEGDCLPECCGAPMKELTPRESGEGEEKHIPLVHEDGGNVYVQVGSVLHPMSEDHYIDWVYLLTDQGAQRKTLHPSLAPKVVFKIEENEVVIAVYAHCTKHGLWKARID